MITVDIKADKTFKEYMLRNGKEMPYDAYMKIKEKYGPSKDDNFIYNEWIQGQQNIEGGFGSNSGGEGERGASENIRLTDETISLEKAKYILEHQDLFTKAQIEKARKVFIL